MTRTGIAIAALLIGTAANAQSGLDAVLSRLESQGFGRFEIEQERGRIKIEAHRGLEERELVYNATTGELLRDTIEQRDGPDRPSSEPAGSLGAGVGPAAVLARAGLGSVYGMLRSEGYESIETEQEHGIIKVEARNGSIERELRYDAQTGALLDDRIDDDDDDDDDDDGRDRDRDRNRDRDRGGSSASAGNGGSGGGNGGSGSNGGGRDDDDDDDDDRGRGRGGDDDDDDDDDRGRGRGGHGDDDDDDDRD